jgi:hypothetical protein
MGLFDGSPLLYTELIDFLGRFTQFPIEWVIKKSQKVICFMYVPQWASCQPPPALHLVQVKSLKFYEFHLQT